MGAPRITPRITRSRLTVATVLTALSALVAAALVAAALVAAPASAHGAAMLPGSRTYLCWKDGLTPNGAIVPNNPACAAAVAQSGPNSLYNWFAVLRSDGAGRMSGFIPDGKLCSGGAVVYDFSGFDLPRADWPVTHLTSGASVRIKYNKWAAHPGTFRSYITKDTWSPTRPLAWSDLESTPFDSVTDPPSVGSPGNEDAYYYWDARLPSGKSGRHIIYTVWQRSDSNETFYGCSDVVFDGGSGEVTGVGPGGSSPSPSPSASPSPSPSPSPSASPSASPSPSTSPGPGGCAATYTIANQWQGGFQGEVTVRNTGTASIGGWTVGWTLPSGQTITQVWNGTATQSGGSVTVRNVGYNGALAPNASTTFGFLGNASGAVTAPSSVTCTAA
ncbi:lytic polysaccharide monooxygenase [Microtetraspora niveoalba]|uniref:lytic polysaccharide monooxygenase n=1 Tax=Microtetraspora niveoalba TaxID=46175 RepID=UPI000AAAFCB1|nr:lytic polysaccharide monooxygenase [Microtetraspora niveoalba]